MDALSEIEWTWLRPQWLWALLPAFALLVGTHLRCLSDAPPWQRWLSLLVRMVVVLLLTLALTGVVYLQSTRQQMIVYAVDRSASIDAEAREAAADYLMEAVERAKQQGDTAVRVLPFDKRPGTALDAFSMDADQLQSLLAAGETAVNDRSVDVGATAASSADRSPDKLGTNLADAIRAAAASIPPRFVPRIVLLSDGNATEGDSLAAASNTTVPVWTVPMAERAAPEVQLAAVVAPAQVRRGEAFNVDIVINTNRATSGHLDLFRGDVRVAGSEEKQVTLEPGENRLRFPQSVTNESQTRFTARLRGFDQDSLLDNNEATAIVHAEGQPRVLLIDPDVEQMEELRWALEEQQMRLDVRSPRGLPTALTDLQRYDCLVLSNVPAPSMSVQQMEMIRTYVQELGGGLIMLGGDQAFGLGGYYQTQLEQILPVRSNFEKEREKPSLAMVLVIDKSGSMGGERIALAKEAARAAVELLGPRDAIGVVAFDGQPYWVVELRSASDRGAILDRISSIDASGGTNMYPAMDRAYQSLLAANAKVKHCIVLADGQSAPADFEGLAADMAASQITVSTVAMGDDAGTELLQEVARIGQGRYYFCNDPQSVPQIFAKETMEASKSAINELPFLPITVRPTQVLEGIDVDDAPFLLGYVVTRAKPTSEVVLATETGDPLLAWWRYGLGMTVAFTSDAKGRWGAEWLAWPDFGPFWAQVVRHAMRKDDDQGMTLQIQQREDRTKVMVDAVDSRGRFVSDAETQLVLIDPDLNRDLLDMKPIAPGRYEATIPTPVPGAYQLELMQIRNGREPLRQSRSLTRGYPSELRLRPVNESLLQSIATASGGRYGAAAEESVDPAAERTARRPVPLWPWLLMTALCLFVGDVGLRRLQFGQ